MTYLEVCIDGSLQSVLRCFGPMLAGFVFGKVAEGASRAYLEAQFRGIQLQLPGDGPEVVVSTAAEALERLTKTAAGASPKIISQPPRFVPFEL